MAVALSLLLAAWAALAGTRTARRALVQEQQQLVQQQQPRGHDGSRVRASCDVTEPRFGAVGDGKHDDTQALRSALQDCDEVQLPAGKVFLTGPLNLTSNQLLVVDGTLLASTNVSDYPQVAPLISYGWSIDSNCFPFGVEIVPGALNYQAIVNSWNSSNVTVTGSGVIDGQGQPWWERCTKCHYKPPVGEWPHANASCLEAGRPMLLQFTFVTGLNVYGSSVGRPLTIQNSPFWTFTPTYSQNIRIKDLVILAPMNVIGNTDGIDISSSRDAIIENILINNSDDGICMNSGAEEFGMQLAIPTEDVLVRNITCPSGGRGGFRVGIQPGGVRNVTYRDSTLHGQRGISLLGVVGGGGYIHDVLFANISNPRGISFGNCETHGARLPRTGIGQLCATHCACLTDSIVACVRVRLLHAYRWWLGMDAG
jgi:polygalacturonase